MDITLKPWQLRWAQDAGKKRTELNEGKVTDRPDYADHSVLQDDLTANTAACICELAVSLCLNQSWNGAYWLPSEHREASKAPDVGHNVEVRRVRHLGRPMPVKKSEQDCDIFQVWSNPNDLSQVKIIGWAPGVYAWQHGEQLWQEKRALSVDRLWNFSAYERSD